MKKIIFAGLMLTFGTLTFAQDVLFTAKVNQKEVPEIIVESIEEDFPNDTIVDLYGIPVNVIEDVWYVDINRGTNNYYYDTYAVNLSGKNGTLSATYDRDGNLISEHEQMKDIPLPHTIQKAIGQHFPAWSVTGDKVIMTAHQGNYKKTNYKVQLRKGSSVSYAVFDANGNLLKGHQHSVRHKLLARKKHNK